MRDPYVYPYPHDNVLQNKFSVKDKETFDAMEGDFAALRIREMQERPVQGKFDFQHLCRINQYIFQDIFEWAGEPRTIPMEKEERVLGGLSVEYAMPEDIASNVENILKRMNGRAWETMTLDERANAFSEDMADLWKVHSFREGNTRTTVIFCCDFAKHRGIPIDKTLFAHHSKHMRDCLVAASAKFSDLGDLSRPEHLRKIIKESMQRGAVKEKRASAMSMDDWKAQIAKEREKTAGGGDSREKGKDSLNKNDR